MTGSRQPASPKATSDLAALAGSGERTPIDSKRLTAWYDWQARFYHRWRDHYDGPLVSAIAAILGGLHASPLLILDAGCGTGLVSIGLGRRFPKWRIGGVDLSMGMLKVAAAAARAERVPNASFLRADVLAMPFSNGRFDVIVSAGLLPNLNDPGSALVELSRVLKPGGQLVILEFDRDALRPIDRFLMELLIFGQRAISALVPRFRFAARWDLRSSTVDRAALNPRLAKAGFVQQESAASAGHFVLLLRKASA